MFYIERSEDAVRYWSRRRLPYPGGSGIPAGLSDLRDALLALSPQEGRLLSCRYWSNERGGGFDVENVLIYNPGPGRLAKASENGIAFCRVHENPPSAPDGTSYAHLNEYTFRPTPYPDNESIIESFSFSLSGMDRAMIWRAAAQALDNEGPKIDGEFGLHVTITASSRKKINPARALKSLFDGVIAALQCDKAPSDEVVARLSSHCADTQAEVLHLLGGRKPRLSIAPDKPLVGLTATGFIPSPADHLCTEGTLLSQVGDIQRCAVTIYRKDRTLVETPRSPSVRPPETVLPANAAHPTRKVQTVSPHARSSSRRHAGNHSLSAFADWLSREGYAPVTVRTRLSDARRVQAAYGDLDQAYAEDGLAALKDILRYTAADRAEGRPNPTRLDISPGRSGNISTSIYNNLQAATSALRAFERYKASGKTQSTRRSGPGTISS